jgi:hypothetical protein
VDADRRMREWLRTPVIASPCTLLDNMSDIVFPEERGEFNSADG